MSRFDVLVLLAAFAACSLLIIIGGLFNPNTLAYSVAKFVFSLN